jgi:hypothetical protein
MKILSFLLQIYNFFIAFYVFSLHSSNLATLSHKSHWLAGFSVMHTVRNCFASRTVGGCWLASRCTVIDLLTGLASRYLNGFSVKRCVPYASFLPQ